MIAAYFSPLAPAAVLLLGAFILAIILPRLPLGRPGRPDVQYLAPPLLIGLAAAALLGMRLTLGPTAEEQGLEMLSGWNLSTAESAASLSIRADGISLGFLILTLLILFAAALAAPALGRSGQQRGGQGAAGGLALGAGAGFLFVSATPATVGYAVVAFDLITTLYWLQRGQSDLGVARLFLGLLTAGGLALVGAGVMPGMILLGLALWLRLGLYPFIESAIFSERPSAGQVVYLALTLAVGFFLVIRELSAPLPQWVGWLVIGTMLLNGLLAWLVEQRSAIITRLALTLAGPILLVGPLLAQGLAMAYGIGLILSLGALWVSPHLGQPRFSKEAWSYLPALGAGLTLIGLPLTLGWGVRSATYQGLFLSGGAAMTLAVMLADGLALSGLVRYWQVLGSGNESDYRRSVAGLVMMIPFLTPILAPVVLARLSPIGFPPADFKRPLTVFAAMLVTLVGGVGLAYYRAEIIDRLNLSPPILADFIRLRWLLGRWGAVIDRGGKAILRVRVFLEGQHYLGWALFMALVGGLIILLR